MQQEHNAIQHSDTVMYLCVINVAHNLEFVVVVARMYGSIFGSFICLVVIIVGLRQNFFV